MLVKMGTALRAKGFQQKADPVAVRAAYIPGITLKQVGARFGLCAAAVHKIVHEGRPARTAVGAA